MSTKLYSKEEAADEIGVSKSTVYRLMRNREDLIETVDAGGNDYIPQSELDRLKFLRRKVDSASEWRTAVKLTATHDPLGRVMEDEMKVAGIV